MRLKTFINEKRWEKMSSQVPNYLAGSSMSAWLDHEKVSGLKMTPEQHRSEADRLENDEPNPATPTGRIAHSLARVHRKVATTKMIKKEKV